MKKYLLFFTLLFLFIPASSSVDKDSLAQAAMMHASHNNIAALRPLFQKWRKVLPHHIYLYCDMTISRNEGRYDRMIECIDSLRLWYPKQIGTKTKLSLSELKAEGLRQLGEYDELYSFCKNEIKIFKRRGLNKNHLKELYHFQEKASRLLGNNPRAKLLQLADRNLVFDLDTLYKKEKDNVDDFTILRCELALAKTFHKNSDFLTISRQIFNLYVDSLDTEEITQCIKNHSNILIYEGKWNELKEWTKYIKSINRTHAAPMPLYDSLIESLGAMPPFEIQRPQTDCIIPTTYEWPLTFSAKVNDSGNIPFTISTDQPFTLLSQNVALDNKVKVVNDTLFLSTSNGIAEVSPIWIEKLTLGNIIFKNVYAYVVLNSDEILSPFSCAIGLNELMALDKITFYPEKIFIPAHSDTDEKTISSRSLYLSLADGLCAFTHDTLGRIQPLCVDLSYPNNIICKKCSKEESNGTSFHILINDKEYLVNQPLYLGPKSNNFNGILGFPFFRNYFSVSLDFQRMEISANEQCTYQPTRGRFNHDTDKHYLRRNLPALTAGQLMDEDETLFLHLLIALGSNNPEEVALLSKKLRDKQSDFYDAYTEAESLFLSEKYDAATTLLQDVLSNQYPFLNLDNEETATLQALLQHYQLFKNEQSTNIVTGTSSIRINLNKEEYTEIRVNGKKAKAIFEPFYPQTEISEKSAKKMKVKRLGSVGGQTYGIISEIQYNDHFTLKNVPCIILTDKHVSQNNLPHKGKGIRLGWNVLRHFKEIAFEPGILELSMETCNLSSPSANLYHTGNWFVEAETEGSYPSLRIKSKGQSSSMPEDFYIANKKFFSSDFPKKSNKEKPEDIREISLPYLLSNLGKVCFDLEKMQIHFE